MAVIATAIILVVCSIALEPMHSQIGGIWGLAYWTALVLVAQAFPVVLPRGLVASVAITPLLAASVLGGPAAAAVVAAVGATELRELRGTVPWYGSLYNHAVSVIPAVIAGFAYQWLAGSVFQPTVVSLLAFLVAGAAFYIVNAALTGAVFVVRDRRAIRDVAHGEVGQGAVSVLGMVPLAWLMSLAWTVAWWSTLLFALPLLTTRSAYQRIVEIREMFTQTLDALSGAIDKRDPYTAHHSKNVQRIAVDIGAEMRCTEAELEALEWGGLLHDVGKIGISDAVLLKPGKLDRDERALMNKHPVFGAEIIKPVTRLAPEIPIILHHHEWYNGSGYPDHLAGEDIPKLARILHVADAFEAMTAARPYRLVPLTAEAALAEIRKFTGIQFDPVVVEAFVRTSWIRGVADRERPSNVTQVPSLAQVASMRAQTDPSPAVGGDAS